LKAPSAQQAFLPAKLKVPEDGPEKGGKDEKADLNAGFQELIWI